MVVGTWLHRQLAKEQEAPALVHCSALALPCSQPLGSCSVPGCLLLQHTSTITTAGSSTARCSLPALASVRHQASWLASQIVGSEHWEQCTGWRR